MLFFTAAGFLIMVLYSYCLYLLLSQLLEFRPSRWARFLALFILIGIANAIIYPRELTGCLICLAGFLLMILACCTGDLAVRFSAVLIFYPIMVSINYLTEDLGFTIWLHLFQENMTPLSENLLSMSMVALRIPFWYLLYRFTAEWLRQIPQNFTRRMWVILDIVCLSSFTGILTTIYHGDMFTSYQTYPACIACIITSLGICRLGALLSKNLRAQMEIQALKYQQVYYEELENNQEQIRKLRHDMKNHLNVLSLLLKEQKDEDAREYLKSLSGEFSANLRLFCKNPTLNAVLNAKYLLACQRQINCQIQTDIEQLGGLDPVVLCSLFANTLDNSIEACEQIPYSSQRRIQLKARCVNGFLSCEIRNFKCNEIVQKNGKFLTGKPDAVSHGYGLQNVQDMVRRCKGTVKISYTDQEFIVTVLLPV